jgi:hypothetical protein
MASSEGDPPDEIHTPRRLQTKEFARGKNSKVLYYSFNEMMAYAVTTVSKAATAALELTTFLNLFASPSSHISGRASLML